MKSSQRKAMHAKNNKRMEGVGYYVEYRHPQIKNPNRFKKSVFTRKFKTPQDAIKEAYKHQDGNSVVRVWDGTNIINRKVLGHVNLSKKFSEGV